MFAFLKGVFQKFVALFRDRREHLEPEAHWRVGTSDGTIWIIDPEGKHASISLAIAKGIAIETNDTGPWGADLWWLIFGHDGGLALAYPQGATGETEVLDIIVKLPGFDHEAMIEAMQSTSNAVFKVWEA